MPDKLFHLTRSWRAHTYLVLDRFGLVVCVIPKNACRTIKRYLLDVVSIAHAATRDVDLHALCRDRISLLRFPVADRAAILSDLSVVTVVRDPFERIASAFADRVVRPKQRRNNQAMLEWVNGPGASAEPGISFRDFVRYLLAHEEDDALDHHWRPQAAFIRGVETDVVGHVGALHSALSTIAERFALPVTPPEDRPRSAAATWGSSSLADIRSGELRTRGILPPAEALYTPDLRRAIAKRYADDIRLMDALALPCQHETG